MTHRRGLTILELLIVIFVLIGMTSLMVNIFLGASTFSADEEQRIRVGESATRSLSSLDDTLREGRLVLASGTVDGTTYTTSENVLVLGLPSLISGTPSPTYNDIVVVARDTGTNQLLQHTEPYTDSTRPGGTIQLATDISEVYFRYVSDDPTSSTAVTAVVHSTRTNSGRTFNANILLYETLRNHP